MSNPFAKLYESDDMRDAAIFEPVKEYYRPPATFEHGEWHLVALIPKSGGDGQAVEIHECRMPARFYKITALNDETSDGHIRHGFTLSTGSGDKMGMLIVAMALAASAGMLGLGE